jgi:hypothetical protein
MFQGRSSGIRVLTFISISERLIEAHQEIEQAQDIESLNGILDRVNDIVVLENHDWRAEFGRKKIEVP